MRRKRTLILAALLSLASLAVAQQPPSKQPSSNEPTTKEEQSTAQGDAGGPMLSEEISDEAVWSKDATSIDKDAGFVPSEAISADAAIAFPVDI